MEAVIALSVAFFITSSATAEPTDFKIHFTTPGTPNSLHALKSLQRQTSTQGLPDPEHNENNNEETEEDFSSKFSDAITGFGLALLGAIESSDNVVLSPYSVAASVALIQQGALGTTRAQLSRLLGMNSNSSTKGFKKLYTALENRRSGNVLNVASAIFAHNSSTDSFTINRNFRKRAMVAFKTDVYGTNFDYVETATNLINTWIIEQTNGFIQKLITPDTLPAYTRLLLANALFFQGIWKYPFDQSRTDEMDFNLANGKTTRTQFMHCIGKYRGGKFNKIDGGATFIILPFEGEQYSFMGILPGKKSNLDNLVRNLNSTVLLRRLTHTKLKDAKVTIPKFSIQKQLDLGIILKKMGATELFSPRCNISNIGDYNGVAPVLSSAVHSAAFIVDERGATAAAATAFGATPLVAHNDDVYFWADRPFLAILWDAHNSVPLFMARIEDPSVF